MKYDCFNCKIHASKTEAPQSPPMRTKSPCRPDITTGTTKYTPLLLQLRYPGTVHVIILDMCLVFTVQVVYVITHCRTPPNYIHCRGRYCNDTVSISRTSTSTCTLANTSYKSGEIVQVLPIPVLPAEIPHNLRCMKPSDLLK